MVDVSMHDCQLAVVVELKGIGGELEELSVSEWVFLG